MNGYIKLHRQMSEWGWYSNSNTKVVFLDLLLNATFKDSKYMGCELHAGDVVIGRKEMAKKLGLSEQQVRTAINHLISTNEITTKPTNKFTVVTIVNWGKYQLECDETNQQINQQDNQQSTNNQPTSNQQVTTSKECKESKKGKNVNNTYTVMVSRLAEVWNEKAVTNGFRKVAKPNTPYRVSQIKKILKTYTENEVFDSIEKLPDTDFFKGKNDRGWIADFDWFLKENTITKLLEGGYRRNDNDTTRISKYEIDEEKWMHDFDF